MKIKRGGGGVDKDGNAYTLPETEIEVADNHFEKMIEAVRDAPQSPFIMVSPLMWDAIKKRC